MELLSRGYVQSVVTQAGGIIALPTLDFGIDFSVHRVAKDAGLYSDQGAAIDLQLKSTTDAVFRPDEDAYHFDLDVKAYNFLRGPRAKAPRFLVLFVMPKDETLWISQDYDGLVLRHCAYYLSLKGAPATNNTRTITVTVSRHQVFSIAFVQEILQETTS